MSDGLKLLLTDARGVYIPINFAQCFDRKAWGLTKTDLIPLKKGPEHEWYWDAWDAVLNKAEFTCGEGHKWTLHQDGDLWAVCPELMTNEEYEEFFGEPKPEEDEAPVLPDVKLSQWKRAVDLLLEIEEGRAEPEVIQLYNKDAWVMIVPVLSTSHMPAFDAWEDSAPFEVCMNEYTGFICIEEEKDLPDWLIPIAQWVNTTYVARCAWVRFDPDGDIIDGLPTYNWENDNGN